MINSQFKFGLVKNRLNFFKKFEGQFGQGQGHGHQFLIHLRHFYDIDDEKRVQVWMENSKWLKNNHIHTELHNI